MGLADGEYTLLGLGIRTVSFLGIQVYVAGFYVHNDDLEALAAGVLKNIDPAATTATSAEREALVALLSDPEKSKETISHLLTSTSFRSAVRVVPTRNTDFAHLRDGWVRGIQSRSSTEEGEGWEDAVRGFREMFRGQGKVGKGKTLVLVRGKEGGLGVWIDETGRNDGGWSGREVGSVGDERVARYLWLTYLAGKVPASPPLRDSVVSGLCGMLEKPKGVLSDLPPVVDV